MAQDRIRFLTDRLEQMAAIARVIDTAQCFVNYLPEKLPVREFEIFKNLDRAMRALWDASYIELPDDSG